MSCPAAPSLRPPSLHWAYSYINSSIIMQLLTIAIPPLERLAKEGEEGRKKIATITRYVTVVLGLIQGVAYYFYLRTNGIVAYTDGFAGVFVAVVIVLTFTAGTALIMWMGEQINEKGVGNGISIILFAGILSRVPNMVTMGASYIRTKAPSAACGLRCWSSACLRWSF